VVINREIASRAGIGKENGTARLPGHELTNKGKAAYGDSGHVNTTPAAPYRISRYEMSSGLEKNCPGESIESCTN